MTPEDLSSRILATYIDEGAQPVDLPVLQPAEVLLDLYGEDIRARAFTTRDPLLGELMLRPDFTVPVVQMHLSSERSAARYAYSGKVFRMQEADESLPSEYDQVGYEYLGAANAAAADAEIYALFSRILSDVPLRCAIGDIGILRAAIEGLSCSEIRKSALLRHLWRPAKFRRLLDRFAGRSKNSVSRDFLSKGPTHDLIVSPLIGLRSKEEIEARVERLQQDAQEEPLPLDELQQIETLLSLREKAPIALEKLSGLSLNGLEPAIETFNDRLDALVAHNVDINALDYEGSYGRTNMEYYDGFVFGFYADATPMPPVATGGRYDALAAALGGNVSAVGGMIRPALLAKLVQ